MAEKKVKDVMHLNVKLTYLKTINFPQHWTFYLSKTNTFYYKIGHWVR